MPKIVENSKIYLAVIQVVSERGYSGATTKQMADAANVSEMTLFRKCGNKAELVKQAIAFIIKETDFSSAARYTGDVHTDLFRVVQAYRDAAVKNGLFIFALIADLARHPELINSMREPFNIFQSIGTLISRYQIEGVLKTEHPLHSVAKLLAPIVYVSMIRNTNMDDTLPNLDLSEHVTSYLEGHCTDRKILEGQL
jgi:AcrR family transcriptional regulator